MRVASELSAAEIATRLGTDEGSVGATLDTAFEKLRDLPAGGVG